MLKWKLCSYVFASLLFSAPALGQDARGGNVVRVQTQPPKVEQDDGYCDIRITA